MSNGVDFEASTRVESQNKGGQNGNPIEYFFRGRARLKNCSLEELECASYIPGIPGHALLCSCVCFAPSQPPRNCHPPLKHDARHLTIFWPSSGNISCAPARCSLPSWG